MMENSIYDNGFVKIPRTILDWQWYDDEIVSRVYFHILLKVNYKEKNWRGNQIKEGEFITSLEKLKIELNLSIQKIRTALEKLVITNYIELLPTNRYTKIKVLNSDVYDTLPVQSNKPSNSPATVQQQTNNNQSTTTKKENKEKNLEEKKEFFKNEVFKHKNTYPESFLTSFFRYWSEENEQTGRLKFEVENYWNLDTRLSRWKQPEDENKKKSLIKNRQ